MDDFNFDEANARFNKEKLLEEVASDKQEQEEEPAYNKDSSFFDNISCEATDRKDGKEKVRATMSEQRRIDAETFGQAGFSQDGRGRSSRGRGGRRYNNSYSQHNNPSGGGGSSGNQRQEQKVFRPVNQNDRNVSRGGQGGGNSKQSSREQTHTTQHS
jgi:protein LSM14